MLHISVCHDRHFTLSTVHLSLICSVSAWYLFFLHDVCGSHRFNTTLCSRSLFCLSPFCSLSSLCRGGALSDGWSAQTDPDPAWGDGEHVVMLVALLKSALLKPRIGNQTDCGPVGLESQYIFWYLMLSSARSSLEKLQLCFCFLKLHGQNWPF